MEGEKTSKRLKIIRSNSFVATQFSVTYDKYKRDEVLGKETFSLLRSSYGLRFKRFV